MVVKSTAMANLGAEILCLQNWWVGWLFLGDIVSGFVCVSFSLLYFFFGCGGRLGSFNISGQRGKEVLSVFLHVLT